MAIVSSKAQLAAFAVWRVTVVFLTTIALTDQPVGGSESSTPSSRASFSTADVEFFESRIRPVLVNHCYECHSLQAETLQAGLLLDSRAAILAGGDGGPAAIVGEDDHSGLIAAMRYETLEMPPSGMLPPPVIDDFAEWIRRGLPWPQEADKISAVRSALHESTDQAAGRDYWAFRPLPQTVLPSVIDRSWSRTAADRFILAKLEAEGIRPAGEATRRQLIRRATFDLTGLPPSFEDVERFVDDESPDAYDRLLDRLLGSPHYGERWARPWLDLVRYAEDNLENVPEARHAFRYRDWVIEALNRDLPYDAFVRRQLAADLDPTLPTSESAALGLLGLSPTYFKGPKQTKQVLGTILADEWEEKIDVVTRTFLGLTVACARCHDHKYDPITTADYYALAGVMASTQLVEAPLTAMFPEDAELIAGLSEELRYHRQRYAQRTKQRAGLIKAGAPDVYRYDKEILESASEIQRITSLLPDGYEKVPRANAVRDAANTINDESYVIRELFSPEARFWTRVEYAVGQARDVAIQIRGNVGQLGPLVPRRFIEVLSDEESRAFGEGSGRMELAEAILEQARPLTARVVVNRLWAWHWGEGLVRTPSNFGALGEQPTHPRLLDALATDLLTFDWSWKRMHREVMYGAAYRQSSIREPSESQNDPSNRLLSRMNRRRHDVEQWRDAALAASESLALKMGGPSVDLDGRRRTVYCGVSRRQLEPLLRLFDFPQPTRHSPERVSTTTPLQLLYFLNGEFIRRQADSIAGDMMDASTEQSGIRDTFRRVLARDPTNEEIRAASELLAGVESLELVDRWSLLAQALLMSNEFMFVD